MKQQSPPIFIPLKTEHYEAFDRGLKTHEIRLNGKRWNRKTCFPGRAVVLSKGYGANSRMAGRILSVEVFPAYQLPADEYEDFVGCYGHSNTATDMREVIYIGIRIDAGE